MAYTLMVEHLDQEEREKVEEALGEEPQDGQELAELLR